MRLAGFDGCVDGGKRRVWGVLYAWLASVILTQHGHYFIAHKLPEQAFSDLKLLGTTTIR